MNEILIKRLKSFAWRLGMYLLVVALAWISENIGLLELNPMATTFIALIAGEVSKYLNTAK